MRGGIVAAALVVIIGGVAAEPRAEAVPTLPGYGPPPSRMWSGFLNASAAEDGTMLHYWFAEAEAPLPSQLPVVLWLNGGPGSTSIIGMMQEMGPVVQNATGGLMRNPYAWTKQANLLILESPAGVGYSYCKAMLQGGSCSNTDKSTAAANRAALQDFFATKFPELRSNRFFITGESYAGVYVPTLAKEILTHAPEINLKGIAAGDPCTDNDAQHDSMDMLWYGHKYGFVPDSDFNFLWNNCSARHPSFIAQGRWQKTQGRWKTMARSSTSFPADIDRKCLAANRRFLASTSRSFSQSWPLAWINDLTLYGPAATVTYDQSGSLNQLLAKWMMSAEVRQALHVDGAPATAWPGPSGNWSYTSDYAACNDQAAPGAPSMVDFYREIAVRLERTIVFNGDTDPCVAYEGTRAAIAKVGFSELEGHQYRPWFYNHAKASAEVLAQKPELFGPNLALQDAGAQLGGHVVDYMHNLSFVTVHGSGHMVPQFRPQAAEMLLQRLLTGSPFAAPLPSNVQLETMTDAEFDEALDAWTKTGKQAVTPSQGEFSVKHEHDSHELVV